MAKLPSHLCVVLASVNLDVEDVRKQITSAAADTAAHDERVSLVETAAQLLALEKAIGAVLSAQFDLGSTPEATKP